MFRSSISRFGRTIITQTLIQTISSIYIFNSSIPWFIRQTYLYYQVIYLDLSWQWFDTTMDFDVYVTSVESHSYLYTWYLYWFDGLLPFEFNLVDVLFVLGNQFGVWFRFVPGYEHKPLTNPCQVRLKFTLKFYAILKSLPYPKANLHLSSNRLMNSCLVEWSWSVKANTW